MCFAVLIARITLLVAVALTGMVADGFCDVWPLGACGLCVVLLAAVVIAVAVDVAVVGDRNSSQIPASCVVIPVALIFMCWLLLVGMLLLLLLLLLLLVGCQLLVLLSSMVAVVVWVVSGHYQCANP